MAGPRYAIGDAAQLVGVSRAMLRIWERERLVEPGRSAGGHRLYSEGDLRRLRQIARLRREERLNTAAIRRELGAVGGDGASPGPAAAMGAERGVGPRLRALRAAGGWSLAAVATRSGFSVSFLSAVERGHANPSVGTLFKLADAYGTTVPGLNAAPAGGGRRPRTCSIPASGRGSSPAAARS
jgi:DNA-binding transcriptional MerR regulator